jgi:hypothetical protein
MYLWHNANPYISSCPKFSLINWENIYPDYNSQMKYHSCEGLCKYWKVPVTINKAKKGKGSGNTECTKIL